MNRYYTGVGSRKIPIYIYKFLKNVALTMEREGWKVRTGNANGCDQIFRTYTDAIVYHPQQIISNLEHWSYEEVQKHMPNDREGYVDWKPYVKALLARNMMQVLGDDGKTPSEFLICWTPSTHYADSSSGGTGYAIRCAIAHNVPVYNIFSVTDYRAFIKFYNSLGKK